jgi:hypothetical protein
MSPSHASTVFVLLGLCFLSSGCTRRGGANSPQDPLAQAVRNYQIGGPDFALLIGQVLRGYGVPFGIELNREVKQRAISVKVSEGTVADVIGAVVAQAPGYRWAEVNGVVDVIPQDVSDSVLELRIARFSVKNAAAEDIRPAVVSLPEVKAWLAQNHVVERSFGTPLFPAQRAGLPRISLDLSNVTLREILNRVVKEANFHEWLVARYGDRNQYLEISIT